VARNFKRMKETVYDIIKFIILGITTFILLNIIESTFLVTYLKKNLLTIQLAALAINVSIFSLIISKIQSIKKTHPEFNVSSILKSLKSALKEQIIIIVIGILVLSVIDSFISKIVYKSITMESILEIALIAIFYNTIQIMWDTGDGMFHLVQAEERISK